MTLRDPTSTPETAAPVASAAGHSPGEQRALLQACRALLAPLARLAVGHGLTFAAVAEVLKQGFVHAARAAHPGAAALSWERFSELVAKINLPVYALGGMAETSLTVAQHSGGQGIAAIRAFLEEPTANTVGANAFAPESE